MIRTQNMTRNAATLTLVCFLALHPWANGASPARIPDDLPLGAVQWTGGFWHDRMKRLRSWKAGDVVDLEMPMPVRYMVAHPAVADASDKVAVMRGPIVYCIECDDLPADIGLEHIRVSAGADMKPAGTKELGNVTKLTGSLIYSASKTATGVKLIHDEAETALYREARFAEGEQALSPGDRRISVSMISYYARLNRKSDYFRIWLPVY